MCDPLTVTAVATAVKVGYVSGTLIPGIAAGVGIGAAVKNQVDNKNQAKDDMKRAQDTAIKTQKDSYDKILNRPGPSPSPTQIQPPDDSTAKERQRRLRDMQLGLSSTIKTGSLGAQKKPNVYRPTLGGYTQPTKTLLGE